MTTQERIALLARSAVSAAQNEDLHTSKGYLVELFKTIHQTPSLILGISYYKTMGMAYTLMFTDDDLRISNDEDTLQIIVNNAYYCYSKALRIDGNLSDSDFLRKNRIIVIDFGREFFRYTVMNALYGDMDITLHSTQSYWHKTIGDMRKMEFVDLNSYPKIVSIPRFAQLKAEYEDYFKNISSAEVIKAGELNHKKVFQYLENKFGNNDDE